MKTILNPLLEILCGSGVYSSLSTRINNVLGHKDYISQLPDDILVSIIVRLPTKTAVRTSILSKRWRNLYKFMSSFQLQCTELVPPSHDPDSHSRLVIHSLVRMLRLFPSHQHSKIHAFNLTCSARSTSNLFKQCMYHLGKSGLEKLDLSLSCSNRIYASFPCQLLSYLPSLKYLKLRWCKLEPDSKTKHHSLQTLVLHQAIVTAGFVEGVLSNCLSLASLSVFFCHCPRKLCFRGAPLETLKILSCSGADEVELHLENLSKFEFKSKRVVTFVFDHVPQLQTVFVSFEKHNMVPFVFGQLPNHVEFLAFDTKGDFSQEMINHPLIFGKLRRLDINVFCTPTTNLLVLTRYLESCPVLEELRLNMQLQDVKHYDVVEVESEAVHRKLKKVEMSGFGGTNNEMRFLSYILKTGVALKQLRIVAGLEYYSGFEFCRSKLSSWSKETRLNIVQTFLAQPRATGLRLILHHNP